MARNFSKYIAPCVVTLSAILTVAIPTPASAFLGIGDTSFDVPLQTIAGGILAKQSASTAFESKQLQSDIKEEIKTYVLDVLAYNVAQQLSTKLTSSVVNWANGGFQGAPTFVDDIGQYFKQQGESVLGGSLASLQSIGNTNPFARDLALQLVNSAQTGNKNDLTNGLKFNLQQVIGPNYQQFYTDASVGGWAGWNAIAQTQNNPIGSLLYTNQAIQNKTIQLNQDAQLEIGSGSGFLNVKKCKAWKPTPAATLGTSQTYTDTIYDENGNVLFEGTVTEELNEDPSSAQLRQDLWRGDPTNCQNWETETPGGTIKASLDKALGVPQDQLKTVDKFKELLSSSLSSLITGLTNAGLNALTSSFVQQPAGSIGMPSALTNTDWLNQPNQIVDIDEQQRIQLQNGSYATNIACPPGQIQATGGAICI